MKALEFKTEINTHNHINIPKDFQNLLKKHQKVRVILLVEDEQNIEDDIEWNKMANQQFLNGYSEKDSIYDTL